MWLREIAFDAVVDVVVFLCCAQFTATNLHKSKALKATSMLFLLGCMVGCMVGFG